MIYYTAIKPGPGLYPFLQRVGRNHVTDFVYLVSVIRRTHAPDFLGF